MTFENITEKSVLNAAGRLVDPGKKITMPVSYYAEQKDFIDAYVKNGKAKVTGIDEYKKFIENGAEVKKEEEVEKVDLMEEVQNEEAEKEQEAQKAENKEEEKKETPKKSSRRRRATQKTEE